MKKLVFIILLYGCILPVVAQMPGGTYTINSGAAATLTNFTNFASAVSQMVSNTRSDGGPLHGAAGIGGPVVFQVSSNTYNEQIVLPAITGASATNTIIFEGVSGDSSLTTLAWPTSTGSNYTVQINGSFITFRKMTLRRTGTGTSSRVIDFAGNGTNITINNCRVINEYSGANALSYTINDQTITAISQSLTI